MHHSKMGALAQTNHDIVYGKKSYRVEKKTEAQCIQDNIQFLKEARHNNVATIWGYNGDYNLYFKAKPNAKRVAKVIWSEIFHNKTNILFQYRKHFFVLGQNGVYKEFQKMVDLVHFLRDQFWHLSLFNIVYEQKNTKKGDYKHYPVEFQDLAGKNFVSDVAEYFLATTPDKSAADFRNIMMWGEGKIIFTDQLIDLKHPECTALVDTVETMQGLAHTSIPYPTCDQNKVDYLVQQIIMTYGRGNADRYLYSLLLSLKGELKDSKYLIVTSGGRHSGTTTLQESLKCGLGNLVSTINGEAILFQQKNEQAEPARKFAPFRDMYSLIYFITDYPSREVDGGNIKKLSGGESFEARSLFDDGGPIAYFLPGMVFVGNAILKCKELDVRACFITFLRERVLVPSVGRRELLLALGFSRRKIRLQNKPTVEKLRSAEYFSQWIHVFQQLNVGKTIFRTKTKTPVADYPELQHPERDKLYWSLGELHSQMTCILQQHFCVTYHPSDRVVLETFSDIFSGYSFASVAPTHLQWQEHLMDTCDFPRTLGGPRAVNTGVKSHGGPMICEQTFARRTVTTEMGKHKAHTFLGLRLRNPENGFEDESFHSEDFPLHHQIRYRKARKAYEKRRVDRIVAFDKEYTYVPQPLGGPDAAEVPGPPLPQPGDQANDY